MVNGHGAHSGECVLVPALSRDGGQLMGAWRLDGLAQVLVCVDLAVRCSVVHCLAVVCHADHMPLLHGRSRIGRFHSASWSF